MAHGYGMHVEVDADSVVHVYPAHGRAHDTECADDCWCEPEREFTADGELVIHHRDMN